MASWDETSSSNMFIMEELSVKWWYSEEGDKRLPAVWPEEATHLDKTLKEIFLGSWSTTIFYQVSKSLYNQQKVSGTMPEAIDNSNQLSTLQRTNNRRQFSFIHLSNFSVDDSKWHVFWRDWQLLKNSNTSQSSTSPRTNNRGWDLILQSLKVYCWCFNIARLLASGSWTIPLTITNLSSTFLKRFSPVRYFTTVAVEVLKSHYQPAGTISLTIPKTISNGNQPTTSRRTNKVLAVKLGSLLTMLPSQQSITRTTSTL